MATSIDTILSHDKNQGDYYALLGCDETSTPEQIITEYKVRALQFHPDKNYGDQGAQLKFQLLNEAKETLCNLDQRKSYDKWRNSGISISYKNWKNMKDHVHQSMHWAKLNTKDRMLLENPENSSQFLDPPSISQHASEGGANIFCKPNSGFKWDHESNNDIISKFRNYEI